MDSVLWFIGVSLRYFNPIGYHSSNLFRDELTEDVGSIMQQIIKVALGKNKFLVFDKKRKRSCKRLGINNIVKQLQAASGACVNTC